MTPWNYSAYQGVYGPPPGADARCLVTIESAGMVWVAVRAWHHEQRIWLNGGEPNVLEKIIAWQPLPPPATGRWSRGQLLDVEPT